MKVNPKAVKGDGNVPGIGGEGEGPIVEQSPRNIEQVNRTPIEEQTDVEEEEPEESEQDKYRRNHHSIKPNNNNKVKFFVE